MRGGRNGEVGYENVRRRKRGNFEFGETVLFQSLSHCVRLLASENLTAKSPPYHPSTRGGGRISRRIGLEQISPSEEDSEFEAKCFASF